MTMILTLLIGSLVAQLEYLLPPLGWQLRQHLRLEPADHDGGGEQGVELLPVAAARELTKETLRGKGTRGEGGRERGSQGGREQGRKGGRERERDACRRG